MARTTIEALQQRRRAAMSADERAIVDAAYEATRLALDLEVTVELSAAS